MFKIIRYSIKQLVQFRCFDLFERRGELNYDDLVSKYWPEFGQNGKEKVTVEMLMTHRVCFIKCEYCCIL